MEVSDNTQLLQSVFDAASNGLAVMRFEYDASGDIVDFTALLFNAAAIEWIGDAGYKDKRYSDLVPGAVETGILAKFVEVATTGTTATFESCHESKGTNCWFRYTAVRRAELLVVTTEDISGQKQAELLAGQTLKYAERQTRLLNSIMDNTPDLVYVFDLAYRFTYANKALLTMWGKTAAQAIGKGLRENGYQEWHALLHEGEIDEIVATKKTIRGTVSFPHAKLGNRIYDYILVPVINDLGHVEAIAGTTRDITEIKTAEEKLKHSESRLRNLITTTPVGTAILTGPDMVIEVANDVILKYWRRDATVIGKPRSEVLPELSGQPFPSLLQKVYTTGISHFDNEALAYFGNAQGKFDPVYFNYSYTALREADGSIYGVSVMAIDVTLDVLSRKQLLESEGRFRNLADDSPMFVFIIEPDPLAPVNYWNKTYLEYTGQTFEQAQGRAWDGIIHQDDIGIVMSHYAPAFENHQPYFIPAVRTKRYDGVYRWYAFKGNPRYAADGSFNGYVGVGFDVHDQKITEEKLELLVQKRTKDLSRSNDDLQQFAHVASHDLREPVRKIKTFLGRLEEHLDGNLDTTAYRYFERIRVAANRMDTMIDGVLTYSTVSENVQPLERVDLNAVMENIETDLEVVLEDTADVIIRQALPVLEGAQVLLYQLFYNLVKNSLKFARKDVPPRITITSTIIGYPDTEAPIARITVQDNGIGFSPGHEKAIFKTFTRLHPKDQYEGTGLGLSLCRKIAERHQGAITASGQDGKGATFVVTLPLRQTKTYI